MKISDDSNVMELSNADTKWIHEDIDAVCQAVHEEGNNILGFLSQQSERLDKIILLLENIYMFHVRETRE